MSHYKRYLSLFLAILVVCTMVPVTAFAAEPTGNDTKIAAPEDGIAADYPGASEPGHVGMEKSAAWVDPAAGTAEVTFHVHGTDTASAGSDTVVVFDRSGSMDDKGGTIKLYRTCDGTKFTEEGIFRTYYSCDACGKEYDRAPSVCNNKEVRGCGSTSFSGSANHWICNECGNEHKSEIKPTLCEKRSTTRLNLAKLAAKKFVATMLPTGETRNNRVALVSFAGSASNDNDLTGNANDLNAAISSLDGDGGTNYTVALQEAQNIISARTGEYANRPAYVVFLSDGEPDSSIKNGTAQANELKGDGVQIYAIAVNIKNADAAPLKNIASTPEATYFHNVSTATVGDLGDVFQSIAGSIKNAGTDATLTDVLGDDFMLDTDRPITVNDKPVTESTVIVDEPTVTWKLGDIPKGGSTLVIPVKLKNNATAHQTLFETNKGNASLIYTNFNGHDCKQVVETPVLERAATQVTVTFDTNPLPTGETAQEISLTKGTTLDNKFPAAPTREGYLFTGWNTKTDGSGTAFVDTTTVAGDTTVYAQWELNKALWGTVSMWHYDGTNKVGNPVKDAMHNGETKYLADDSVYLSKSAIDTYAQDHIEAVHADHPKNFFRYVPGSYEVVTCSTDSSEWSDPLDEKDVKVHGNLETRIHVKYDPPQAVTVLYYHGTTLIGKSRVWKNRATVESLADTYYSNDEITIGTDGTFEINTMAMCPKNAHIDSVTSDGKPIKDDSYRVKYGYVNQENPEQNVSNDIVIVYEADDKFTVDYTLPKDCTGTAPDDFTDYVNTEYTLKGAPEWANHTFAGWKIVNGGDTLYQADDTKYKLTENVTYLAVYHENDKFTVTYDPKNGNSSFKDDRNYFEGENYTLVGAPEFVGHEFMGWMMVPSTDNKLYPAGTTLAMPSGNVQFEAVWKELAPITYTLTYDLAGGEGVDTDGGKHAAKESITISDAPTKTKHRFIEWENKNTQTTYEPSANFEMPAHDVTFTAIWAELFTVNFDLNGATIPAISPVTDVKGTPITLPTPVWEGHEFMGWEENGSPLQGGASYNIFIDTTLVAQWKEIPVVTYTLTYDLAGGEGAGITGGNYAAETKLTVTDIVPTKENFVFVNWKKELAPGSNPGTGDKELYENGESLIMPACNTTLIAQWKPSAPVVVPVSYTVEHFYAVDGITFPTEASVTEDGTGNPGDSIEIEPLIKLTYQGKNYLMDSNNGESGSYTLKAEGKNVIEIRYLPEEIDVPERTTEAQIAHTYFLNGAQEDEDSKTLTIPLDENGRYTLPSIEVWLQASFKNNNYTTQYPVIIRAIMTESAPAIKDDITPGSSGELTLPEGTDVAVGDTSVAVPDAPPASITKVVTKELNKGESFTFDDAHSYEIAINYLRTVEDPKPDPEPEPDPDPKPEPKPEPQPDDDDDDDDDDTTTIPKPEIPLGNNPGLVTIVKPMLPLGNLPKSGSSAKLIATIGGLLILSAWTTNRFNGMDEVEEDEKDDEE